jgi:hypothetical protein
MRAWKHPATVIAALALFVALGGGAALASGLISGKQIANHSIPAKKLTAAAIKTLQGQPDGAIPIKLTQIGPGPGIELTGEPVRGVDIRVACDPTTRLVRIGLANPAAGELSVSGRITADDVTTPITREAVPNDGLNISGKNTLNLDLVVLSGDALTVVSRFDLAGTLTNSPSGPHACDFWGLVTPGT